MERINNIYDIVYKLCGPIEPVGETNTDDERLENLRQIIILAENLISDIYEVSRFSDRCEYSMKQAGEKAANALNFIKEVYLDEF